MRRAFIIGAIALLVFIQPAQTQTPSPEATAAAKELIETMRLTEQFKKLMPIVLQQLKPAIVQGRETIARDYDSLMPVLMEAMSGRFVELEAAISGVYALSFTAAELQELTRFYRAPIGQKFLERMPALTQQTMMVGSKFGEQMAAELRAEMIEKLRKRGHNI